MSWNQRLVNSRIVQALVGGDMLDTQEGSQGPAPDPEGPGGAISGAKV